VRHTRKERQRPAAVSSGSARAVQCRLRQRQSIDHCKASIRILRGIQKSATSGEIRPLVLLARPCASSLTRPSLQVTRSLTHESGLAATHIALLFILLSRSVRRRSHRSAHAEFSKVRLGSLGSSRSVSFLSFRLTGFRLRVQRSVLACGTTGISIIWCPPQLFGSWRSTTT
jgi:hypothetical protein